jgi:hypothetical protein
MASPRTSSGTPPRQTRRRSRASPDSSRRSGSGARSLWADQGAYEHYIKGEIFNALRTDQNLKNFESRDFGVFEDLSSLTMTKLHAA